MKTSKSGQAIVEFVVGLVAILIITAALLQIGTLVRADTRTLQEARADAGRDALGNEYFEPISPGPRYIRDWGVGGDGNAYTRDDLPVLGNSALLSDGVVGNARPEALGALAPGNPVTAIGRSDQVLSGLGFVRGHSSSGPIPLLPVTRNLIFGRDSITLESQVFLIYTRGLE
jgi:hypothetical protein